MTRSNGELNGQTKVPLEFVISIVTLIATGAFFVGIFWVSQSNANTRIEKLEEGSDKQFRILRRLENRMIRLETAQGLQPLPIPADEANE